RFLCREDDEPWDDGTRSSSTSVQRMLICTSFSGNNTDATRFRKCYAKRHGRSKLNLGQEGQDSQPRSSLRGHFSSQPAAPVREPHGGSRSLDPASLILASGSRQPAG